MTVDLMKLPLDVRLPMTEKALRAIEKWGNDALTEQQSSGPMNDNLRRQIERVIWQAAIQCAADEADREWIEAGGEELRLRVVKTQEHSPLAERLCQKLYRCDPPRSEWIGAPDET